MGATERGHCKGQLGREVRVVRREIQGGVLRGILRGEALLVE